VKVVDKKQSTFDAIAIGNSFLHNNVFEKILRSINQLPIKCFAFVIFAVFALCLRYFPTIV